MRGQGRAVFTDYKIQWPNFSFLIAHYQVGLIFSTSSATSPNCPLRLDQFPVCTKDDWFKRKQSFACFIHGLDAFLEPLWGSTRAELIV